MNTFFDNNEVSHELNPSVQESVLDIADSRVN